MGKRLLWTALAGLVTHSAQAAPPEPLPADQLDFQPWGEDAPADALCRGRYVMPAYRLAPGDTPREVLSTSDEAEYGETGETLLRGEVILRRDSSQLEAPRVRVNAARDTAFAEGPLTLRDRNVLVRGGDGQVSLDSDAAQIDTAHYVLHGQHLRGDAVQLARLEDGRYRLREASFTTCDPGSRLWRVVGNDVLLDREAGYGTARNARLEVGRVPVFYWPWVRFPLDDRRQSGFLWPTLGFSNDGVDYAQPYYFNLAPNYDATLTPRWIGNHGEMLGGEFRYLFGSDAGRVEGAYLANDKGGASSNPNDPDDAFEGEDRWYLDYRHAGTFSPRTRYALRYGAASDGRYFDDFGRSFAEQETDYMERLAQLDYSGDTWQLQAKAQGYQKLDYPLLDRDKPFYRLPSLTANARWSQGGFYEQWLSNVTYFWRDVDETQVPSREAATGTRLHLAPAFGWRGEPSWGFLEPRLQLWHSQYQLDYGNRDTDRDTRLSLTVPVYSLDSGLVFERDTQLFGDAWRQTLEPRLYYAYVPERDQSEFPDFDTDEQAISYGQLWSPFRFSGSDRIGDTNKLSYGAATRFLEDDSGRQRFSLAVGQSAYFSDRNIDMGGDPDTLPSRENDYQAWYNATRDHSPVITQLDWQLSDHWSTRYEWFYDPHRSLTERTAAYLRYRHPEGHVLNLGYVWQLEGFDPSAEDEDRLGYDREDFDVSFAYRFGAKLDLIGRYTYDNTNSRSLDQLVGVQWNDCCYGVQVAWREWVEDNDTANTIADDYTDRGLFLRFVFKGLGGVGQGTDAFFEQSIPGYQPAPL
ncbi:MULTISPECIES: LPS-assembly protein LptD [unclassified Modicisalibacter]|uniref:LPS-assembly protein LptD n=1 Tax=unclassified Modicisalibacter TaxID=2679913 RepID=UPI001CCDF395|nr:MULTISPECIES: LPS-assembly protein LptD [unclassified Modicisalibacter]MBZ9559332.1 LPS-assembly protein LptD [Modicisalibacter sp. R2A 31.J]MBZ9576503.1 LPS-assembly protein LptD [Modicisalibacter sp. MOD 31.J]